MTPAEARDIIFAAAIAPCHVVSCPVVFTDLPEDIPDSDLWCRFTIRHSFGSLSSLGNATGKLKYEQSGTLFVQVFSRIGQGFIDAYSLAQDIMVALRKEKNGCVWFRNVRINEIGQAGGFSQINVIANFSYEDVQ